MPLLSERNRQKRLDWVLNLVDWTIEDGNAWFDLARLKPIALDRMFYQRRSRMTAGTSLIVPASDTMDGWLLQVVLAHIQLLPDCMYIRQMEDDDKK
ncbi:hypothetical protein RO3G_13064 [Rhizopus delemar RA 99-880]|uniref:Uncharacterized protein n=1 Tax=Rhizopus delemar (strain RA 99-880 / ATCC MYA-4621 / FGSC 9543 / NRRL 43880) TaxID=246409 RepID=I1CIS3_RHIO9|nr:hypothetical protein RO3G_13064 [Rhizopus delemar RA 99-880]|eukprot:EIE88353.1 hypothetical protein RO3G_13064 [Rhizopus delemar RA 99-880]